MIIQAEVSVYPLQTDNPAQIIKMFCRSLEREIPDVHIGPMSTMIRGESDILFASIQHAFDHVAAKHSVVMTLKCSNACPALE